MLLILKQLIFFKDGKISSENLEELREKIYKLENKNMSLEKNITVDKEILIKKLKEEKIIMEDNIKTIKVNFIY